jgi:hypothetical protein
MKLNTFIIIPFRSGQEGRATTIQASKRAGRENEINGGGLVYWSIVSKYLSGFIHANPHNILI